MYSHHLTLGKLVSEFIDHRLEKISGHEPLLLRRKTGADKSEPW